MKDSYNELYPFQSLPPAVRTVSANGAQADLKGFQKATVVVSVGEYTDGTHALTVEESAASGSGFTTVVAGDLLGTLPTISQAGDDNQDYKIGYIGTKRYLRAVVTVTGGPSTGCALGASIVRGYKHHNPTTL